MTICIKCNRNEVPPNRKTKCHPCAEIDELAWKAKQSGSPPIPPVPQPVDPQVVKVGIDAKEVNINPTAYTKTLAANSYEVGPTGNRFKLYFETPAELKAKMQELRAAGLMDMPLEAIIPD